ncbi:MAG TPA: PAS domain-containing sensor histidine kinase [Polyangia bacterium]|nr:PAS domain-containing sensor histidine kinase [Polyangia bacterium]
MARVSQAVGPQPLESDGRRSLRAGWMRLLAPIQRLGARVLWIGVRSGLPVAVRKRIRLCNINALGASIIMAAWAAVEAIVGTRGNLLWELGFLGGFLAVLGLTAAGAHRLARLLLIVTANVCVFAGALLFTEPSGGLLPFFAMAAMPLLLFGPDEWLPATLGAALPALLLAAVKTGLATSLLGVQPKPAPGWYFTANAATTFVLAFLVPFFFFRSNIRAESSLQRIGQEKLKRVIDADLIGVVRARLSGRIDDANGTFLSMLGYSRRDLAAGSLDLTMIAPPGASALELAELGPTSVYERICRRKDGTTVPALVGIARLDGSDDSEGDEVIGFLLDLTAQKHLEAQRAMLHDSREALRLRDLFNSIASHELKTPLTALLLNLRLLRVRLEKETAPESPLRAQVVRCQSAAVRMGELIHALLDVAQIHRGRFTLHLRETEVVESVRNVVSGFEVGRRSDLRRIAVRSDGPFTADLDPVRFEQLVTNLLSNAVKYGDGKPIEVRVNHDQAADSAHLEVIDEGPGIAPDMAEKIFEPFQRATSMEPIPGMGLGLYVVKMIVEGHGGRIAVDSEPGRGSRFIVDLPCAHA